MSIEKERARADRFRDQLAKVLVEQAASNAIRSQGGSPELLMPHIASRIKVEETKDGTLVTRIVGDNGRQAYTWRDGAIHDSTVDDVVSEMRTTARYAPAFDAPASGSGASGNKGGGGALAGETNPFAKATFDLTEQGRLYREEPAKYAALKALAVGEKLPSSLPAAGPSSTPPKASGTIPTSVAEMIATARRENPFRQGPTWHLTRQSVVARYNPELAKSLRAAAAAENDQ